MVWDGAGLKYECQGSDHWVKYGFICDLYKTIKPLVRYGFIRRGHALSIARRAGRVGLPGLSCLEVSRQDVAKSLK